MEKYLLFMVRNVSVSNRRHTDRYRFFNSRAQEQKKRMKTELKWYVCLWRGALPVKQKKCSCKAKQKPTKS